MLTQAFLNLRLNASNAMPGGDSSSIRFKPTSQEAVVAMTDTGRSDLLHIIASFETPAAMGPGTGSGLSLCQSCIKHHPGAIEVESAWGPGARFTVRSPRRR